MAYETEHPLINGASNDSPATANIVSNRVATVGSLSSSSDVDYFRIDVNGPSLLELQFSNALLTTTNHWWLALLDGEGDYLQTLARSVTGSVVVDGADQSENTLSVAGIASATVPANSRFTFDVDDQADTVIYTVVNGVKSASGQADLVLNKALSSPEDGTAVVFDPAQAVADGGLTTLTAQVPAAGSYYVKVNAQNWSSADYVLTTKVTSLVESTAANNTAADALTANNRLVSNAWMEGSLSSSTDKDVWLLTTASAADIYIDFAAPSGDDTAPQWNVTIATWDGVNTVPVSVNGVAVSGSAGASKTFQPNSSLPSIDPVGPATYLVTVAPLDGASLNTGAYTVRARGTTLDANDVPVIVVDKVASGGPNANIETGVERSLTQGEGSRVALNTLFSISDADESVSDLSWATYKVALSSVPGSSANGYVRIEPTGEAPYNYVNGTLLSAQEMADAWVYAGTALGEMDLTIQAFDSTDAPDQSGASSFMTQTLKVTSDSVGVTVTGGGVALLEGAASAAAGYSSNLSFVLDSAPAQDVQVYLEQASPNELLLSKSVLTFTPSNYDQVQSVVVRALSDGATEGPHSGDLVFRVVSSDLDYDGLTLDAVTFDLADPVVAPSGYSVGGFVRHWSSADVPLADVAFSLDGQTQLSQANGAFALTGVQDDDGVMVLAPSLTAPQSKAEADVTLTDVLAALKVYLNKPLPEAYDSPYKYLAADFDANGVVNLTDVLQLLKYYLGKPTTNDVAPSWVFVDGNDITGTGSDAVIQGAAGTPVSASKSSPHAVDHDFSGGDPIELIGVLRGDVDGSWAI